MRTTLTLDDDVAAKLAAKARATGKPFKDVVNETLRSGFFSEEKRKTLEPFVIKEEHLLHLDQRYNYDKVELLFDELDGPGRLR
jgi:hypothetical protein